MGKIALFGNWGFLLIILGTIVLAIYKKKKGENYKLVILGGVILFLIYGAFSAILGVYLVAPIYSLTN